MSLLGTIKHLSEDIGPRGSTTESERKASEFVQQELARFGLHTEQQQFLSASSTYSPFAVAMGVVLIALFMFWQPQPVGAGAAALLAVGATVALMLELTLRSNPLRWVVPTGHSQNVWATIPAQSSAWRPPILITVHVDTNRTPLLWRSAIGRQLFHALIPLGMLCLVALIALFALGIFSSARNLRELALIPGAVILLIFALMLQAANAPFTPGANDNASGVAVALGLAQELAQQPLRMRDVIIAFTGCEEVGGYGANAFMTAHRDQLYGAVHLVIDHVGGRAGRDLGPSLIRSERFLVRYASDPGLLAIAEGVIRQRPDLCARVLDFTQAYSELTTGARHHLRTIGLFALDEHGALPNWHIPNDTAANISDVTLERSFEFAKLFLRAVDAEDAG